MPGVVQLIAFGSVSRALLKDLAAPFEDCFHLETVVAADALVEPKYAFNKERGQYHSSAILRRLSGMRTGEQVGVIGVGDFDLFIPDVDFVFGESDRDLRAGVVSLRRLRPEFLGAPRDPELTRRRARTQLTHEAGHLVGLAHCEDARCAMFAAVSLADLDRQGLAPCAACRGELARTARRR
jgi:archaemetzincin